MEYKAVTFKIFDATFYSKWLERGTTKYKVNYFQLGLGHVKHSTGAHWTPAVTIVMNTDPNGQLHKLLYALYTNSTISAISKMLTFEYFGDKNKTIKTRDKAYETVAKILQDDLRKNQYHITALLKTLHCEGGDITQFQTIKKEDRKFYKNVIFKWSSGFKPGTPPGKKSSLDLKQLDVGSLNIEISETQDTSPICGDEPGDSYSALIEEFNPVFAETEYEQEQDQ